VILGSGKPLFQDIKDQVKLKEVSPLRIHGPSSTSGIQFAFWGIALSIYRTVTWISLYRAFREI
jgi:hypothetical protein